MTLDTIQKIRDATHYELTIGDEGGLGLYNDANDALTWTENHSTYLIADDMKSYDSEKDIFIWDDVNQLLNILRTNVEPKTQHDSPILIETFEYSSILYANIATVKLKTYDMLKIIKA